VNDVGDDSPNLKRLLSLNLDRLIVLVGGEEAQRLVSPVESFDRQFSIERGHNHIAVYRFERAIHDENIAGMNACLNHRVTRHPYKERVPESNTACKVEISMTINQFIRIIRGLRSDEPYIDPSKWYTTQKQHWLGWLGEYHGPGRTAARAMRNEMPGTLITILSNSRCCYG